jgi:hypothetical protein
MIKLNPESLGFTDLLSIIQLVEKLALDLLLVKIPIPVFSFYNLKVV